MAVDEHGNSIWLDPEGNRDWDATAMEAEEQAERCDATQTSRCDVGDAAIVAWFEHLCVSDDDHDGAHECACGHTWTESEDN